VYVKSFEISTVVVSSVLAVKVVVSSSEVVAASSAGRADMVPSLYSPSTSLNPVEFPQGGNLSFLV